MLSICNRWSRVYWAKEPRANAFCILEELIALDAEQLDTSAGNGTNGPVRAHEYCVTSLNLAI